MRIAFLDLPFHQKTGSSKFFHKFLERLGQVDTYYIHFAEPHILRELVEADYDLYVLWQLEPFVPFFLYHQCRVAIVPMYDGCHGLGKTYWRAMRGCHAINFSSALAEEQIGSDLTSLNLQYFPDPARYAVQTDFSNARALFWQRRPEHGLSAKFVDTLIGASVDTCHIHNAPDSEDPDDWPVTARQTESRWQSDPSSFDRLMDAHNVFIAPRIAEGIGMAFLEAMARGIFVIAADAPTANEYIRHGQNGYLFKLDEIQNPKPIDMSIAEMERIARGARHTVEIGYAHMRSRDDEVMQFLTSIPRPKRPYIKSKREERLFLNAALQFYRRTRYFKRNIRKTLNYRLHRLALPRMFAPPKTVTQNVEIR